ncbi:MAG: DUF1624 domain-containing protein [Ignavibacterium sp.]|nr:DUF1624 domain-containing protein [Ignavibacterium sp.]
MKERLLNLFYFSERKQTADLLKGIAVLFMIQVHIAESFLFQRLQQEAFGKISFFLGASPAAPVFMIVMGYFLSLKKNLLHYIERGIVLFLGGILLNIGLNFFSLVKYFQSEIIGGNQLEYIFGVDILPFAGLSIIIIGLLKEIFYDRYYLYLITGLLVAFFSDYLPTLNEDSVPLLRYFLSFVYGCSDWSYFPLFPWLFYPLVGFSIKLISDKFSRKFLIPIIFISGFILILFFENNFKQIVELKNYYHHGILLAIWNLAFFIVWFFLIDKLENYLSKNPIMIYIKWIGKNVTAIYVFQWLIIGNLSMILYDSQNELQFFLWFFIVLFLSSALTFYYEKTKMNKISVQTNE